MLVEVKVSVIVPARISAGLGIYVAFSVLLFGEKVPVPLVLHCPEPVLDLPSSGIHLDYLHKTESFLPALTVGAWVKIIFIVSDLQLYTVRYLWL